jgi:hypothetical protein
VHKLTFQSTITLSTCALELTFQLIITLSSLHRSAQPRKQLPVAPVKRVQRSASQPTTPAGQVRTARTVILALAAFCGVLRCVVCQCACQQSLATESGVAVNSLISATVGSQAFLSVFDHELVDRGGHALPACVDARTQAAPDRHSLDSIGEHNSNTSKQEHTENEPSFAASGVTSSSLLSSSSSTTSDSNAAAAAAAELKRVSFPCVLLFLGSICFGEESVWSDVSVCTEQRIAVPSTACNLLPHMQLIITCRTDERHSLAPQVAPLLPPYRLAYQKDASCSAIDPTIPTLLYRLARQKKQQIIEDLEAQLEQSWREEGEAKLRLAELEKTVATSAVSGSQSAADRAILEAKERSHKTAVAKLQASLFVW